MTTHEQQEIDHLAIKSGEGRITGQIPQMFIELGPADPATHNMAVDHDATMRRLVQKGLAAWKVMNTAPGRPKVIYTEDPINPLTGRPVSAFLWMTPLAIDQHADALYAAYASASGHANNTLLGRAQWEQSIRQEVVPVAPQFAHLTPTPLPLPKPPKPKADLSLDAPGFVKRLGPRIAEELVSGRERGTVFMAQLDARKVGPATDLGHYSQQDPNWFERLLVSRGGTQGVARLAQMKRLTANSFSYALAFASSHDYPHVVEVWEKIKSFGVSPTTPASDGGGTLWHALAQAHAWGPTMVDWVRKEGVDWSRPDDHGGLPLGALLRHINISVVDSFRDKGLFGGSSLFDQMKAMAGMMGHADTLDEMEQDLKEDQTELARFKVLALDMIRSGVDPFTPDNDKLRPIDNLYPEQLRMEQVLATQVPPGEDVSSFVMRTMFTGDRSLLIGYRPGYSEGMQFFIGEIEALTKQSILHDTPPTPSATHPLFSRRPK